MSYQAKPLKIDLGQTDSADSIGRTIILYGDSTAGKSSQLATAAEYLYTKTQKKVRLISAEDSTKNVFLPLTRAGIVEALYISKIQDPVSILRRLSKGEWPVNGELVPYERDTVGAYLIEGLSTIAELIQEDNREKRRFLGEQEKTATTENGETLALPGQFSYNFTQMEMVRLLRTFGMIPGLDRVIWTAHEAAGTDDDGKPVRGPATVGRKAVGQIQKYCGTLIHLDIVSENNKVHRRMHFRTHVDPKLPTITSPCKITLPISVQSKFYSLIGAQNDAIDTTVKDGRLVNSLADILKAEDKVMDELSATYLTTLA